MLPMCVSILFTTLKAFATGNLNELCSLQHTPTGSRSKKNNDLRFLACTWCVSNIVQLFCCQVFTSENYTRIISHNIENIIGSLCVATADRTHAIWPVVTYCTAVFINIGCHYCREDVSRGKSQRVSQTQGWVRGLFPMFAHCQWCRKSPSPSTAGLWWPALFPVRHLRRENRKIKAKVLLASRSLHSPAGPWGQLHYTVVCSEVIHVKVETKSLFEKIQMLS